MFRISSSGTVLYGFVDLFFGRGPPEDLLYLFHGLFVDAGRFGDVRLLRQVLCDQLLGAFDGAGAIVIDETMSCGRSMSSMLRPVFLAPAVRSAIARSL